MTDVRRNAFLLALGLVFQSGMIQLAVALGTVTIVAVTGVHSILGLGPAVFLIAGALAVGRVAHEAIGGEYVRHPSHGGAASFAAGLRHLLA